MLTIPKPTEKHKLPPELDQQPETGEIRAKNIHNEKRSKQNKKKNRANKQKNTHTGSYDKNIYNKKEKCSQKAESAVRHAIALRGAGWPGVCVCRASAGGNRSYPDLLERPQQRCWCWVPRCAQQQPSSAHSSAAKAEAELFGARRGDSTEAELLFPPDKVGR